tara:strand:+ start:156 stop:746 length:591 start_codon:yes stop_codon:yes gene_type:complete
MPLAQPVPIPGTSTSTGSSFQEETYNNLTRMSGAQSDPMDIISTPSRQSNFEARNTDDEALAEGEQIKGDEHLDSGGSNVGGVTGSRDEKIGKMSFEGGFSTASEKDDADEEAEKTDSYDTLLEGYEEHGKGYKKMDRQADRASRNEEFDTCMAAAKNQSRKKGRRRKAKKACRQAKRASRKSSRQERRSAYKDSK